MTVSGMKGLDGCTQVVTRVLIAPFCFKGTWHWLAGSLHSLEISTVATAVVIVLKAKSSIVCDSRYSDKQYFTKCQL